MKYLKLKLNKSDFQGGNKYIISDIHGCYNTFTALLDKIKLTKEDHLFLLGDYINRGLQSKKVVDYIIQLMHGGYQVYPLKGNHEQLAESGYKTDEHGMNNEHGKLQQKYLNFFKKLYYYIELDDTLLVHAGFNFSIENPFEDYESMLWSKKKYQNTNPTPGKRIIYGHLRTPLEKIKQAIHKKDLWIPLDNGCYLKNKYGFGNLCCLELNAFKLNIQENIDTMESWNKNK